MGGKKRQAKAQADADEAEQIQTMGEAAGAISNYRPHMQQNLNAALQQQLSAFSGTNSLLGQMGLQGFGNGGQYGNVVGKDTMQVGQTSQAPGWAEDQPSPSKPGLSAGQNMSPTSSQGSRLAGNYFNAKSNTEGGAAEAEGDSDAGSSGRRGQQRRQRRRERRRNRRARRRGGGEG